jgi:hypothetical protein
LFTTFFPQFPPHNSFPHFFHTFPTLTHTHIVSLAFFVEQFFLL